MADMHEHARITIRAPRGRQGQAGPLAFPEEQRLSQRRLPLAEAPMTLPDPTQPTAPPPPIDANNPRIAELFEQT
jgi:hypothetical protein